MVGNFRRILRRFPVIFCAACWLAACGAGCSSNSTESTVGESAEHVGSYRERLKATAFEFAYYERREQNLSPQVWEAQGISLQVPKPFFLVKNPSSENPALGHDPSRQVLGVPLPGVLGMWQAVLPGEDPQSPTETAYLFVMSNQHLWSFSKSSAMAFLQTLVEDVLAGLPGLSRFPIDADWSSANWSGHGLPYATATFQATLPQTKAKADFTLFLFQNGANERRDEIKVAMMFVVPRAAVFRGSQPKVDPKILSAETLRINPGKKNGS